jgi:hypothetical protein
LTRKFNKIMICPPLNFIPGGNNVALIPMRTAANHYRCLPAHFKQTKADSPAVIVCRGQCTHAGMAGDFQLRFYDTLSLSTLLCRRRNHASEVQQLFSTRSLSDVSWGKVRSLTEWRNTPGKPGWVFLDRHTFVKAISRA